MRSKSLRARLGRGISQLLARSRGNPSIALETKRRIKSLRPALEPLECRLTPATIPTPVLDSTSFPNSATVQIESFWDTDGTTGLGEDDHYEIGSGALVDNFHVLTAGHVVYNPDLGYADRIFVHAGRRSETNRPYGEAEGDYWVAPRGWTNQGFDKNFYDIGFITLDRNLGKFTDYFNYGTISDSALRTATLHNIGYPSTDAIDNDLYDGYLQVQGTTKSLYFTPTISSALETVAEPIKILGSAATLLGPAISKGVTRVVDTVSTIVGAIAPVADTGYFTWDLTDLWAYHGSSGSPVFTNDEKIVGVLVRGNDDQDRPGDSGIIEATRITKLWDNWISNLLDNDSTPVDKAALIDSDGWFSPKTRSSTISKGAAKPGESFSVSARVWNGGTARADNVKVRFHLSQDDEYGGSDDINLGDATISSLNPFEAKSATLSTTVPSSIAASGSYHVVWFIDPSDTVSEFGTDLDDYMIEGRISLSDYNKDNGDPFITIYNRDENNNTGAIPFGVTVVFEGDGFEPNNTLATAHNFGPIGSAFINTPSISKSTDVDYYKVQMAASGTFTATIAFTHSRGDVELYLLASDGRQLDSSTSSTNSETVSGTFSSGTILYVKVAGASGAVNPSYTLKITGPSFGADSFEPNDTLTSARDLGILGQRIETGLTLGSGIDGDYFKFTPAVTGNAVAIVSVTSSSSGSHSYQLFDKDRKPLGSPSAIGSNTGGPGDIQEDQYISAKFPVIGGQVYYISFVGNSLSGPAKYSLTLRGPQIAADVYEPNDTLDTAYNLGALGTRTLDKLSLHATGNADNYRFVAAAAGNVTVKLTATPGVGLFDLAAFDNKKTQIAIVRGSSAGTTTITFAVTAGTKYYLRATGGSNVVTGQYSLAFNGPATPSDKFEPNNEASKATDLGTLGSRFESGLIMTSTGSTNDLDFYKFTAALTGRITASVRSTNVPGALGLAALDGTQVQAVKTGTEKIAYLDASQSLSETQTVTFPVEAGKTYYLLVGLLDDSKAVNPTYSLSIMGPSGEPPVLQFESATSVLKKKEGLAQITLVRTGDVSKTSSIRYQTRDGSAVAGADYTATSGTVTFVAGQTTSVISVPILAKSASTTNKTINLSLSDPSGAALGAQNTLVLNIDNGSGTIISAPGQFKLSAAEFTAPEKDGKALIKVLRTGGADGTVVVTYRIDRAASAILKQQGQPDKDVTGALAGSVSFGPGETEKTITVTIANDNLVEADVEFLTLTLTSANGGGTLGGTLAATVGIVDDDVPTVPSEQPSLERLTLAANGFGKSLEHYRDFVSKAYARFLSRQPDEGGFTYWVTLMQMYETSNHAAGLRQEQIEAGFIDSPEYKGRYGGVGEAWVKGIYNDLLGRAFDPNGLAYWVGQLTAGVAPTEVALGFTASDERLRNRVADTYRTLLDREADDAGLAYWVAVFKSGGTTEDISSGFVGSPEYYNKANRGGGNPARWVKETYLDILFRPAAVDELAYWLSVLKG